MSGSHGLLGSALVAELRGAGHETVSLVRSSPSAGDVLWDPARGAIDADGLAGIDAAVHLAGESIAGLRWTPEKKARIRDSRIKGTHLLAGALAGLGRPPGVMVCSSAVGYYGDCGGEPLTEESPAGEGFLAGLCRDWEAAADPAREAGIRVVNARLGVVLSREGGALKQMLAPFKLGLGGKLGSGNQYFSWIAIDDGIAVLMFALERDELSGPVNGVAPEAVTNRELTKTLGRVLKRPAVMGVPRFALRILLGELADEGLLASQRVLPAKLKAMGFGFRYPDLEGALRHVLGRSE